MRAHHALDRPAELALAALLVIGLSLAVLAAVAGIRRLSANWSVGCHRLLNPPTPPGFATPWRVTTLHPDSPCLRRRP